MIVFASTEDPPMTAFELLGSKNNNPYEDSLIANAPPQRTLSQEEQIRLSRIKPTHSLSGSPRLMTAPDAKNRTMSEDDDAFTTNSTYYMTLPNIAYATVTLLLIHSLFGSLRLRKKGFTTRITSTTTNMKKLE